MNKQSGPNVPGMHPEMISLQLKLQHRRLLPDYPHVAVNLKILETGIMMKTVEYKNQAGPGLIYDDLNKFPKRT